MTTFLEKNITTAENFNRLGLRVADNVSALLSYWDEHETCRYANSAFGEWFGRPKAEMDGITLKELLGAIYEKNLPYIKGVLEGKTQVFEREIVLPNGDNRSYIATYYPDFNSDGNVIGFYVHGADITEIKKLEKDLRASEHRFRQFLENAPDALVIVNEKGIIQLSNSQCTRVFGYSKEELVGKHVEELIPESSAFIHPAKREGYMQNPVARAMNSGLKLGGRRKNGEEFPVDISLSPLETEDGILVSAAIRDITQSVEKEKEMLQSVEVISDQNKRLINFTHIVSHNLRTHSGNLSTVLNLFFESEDEAEKQEMLGYLKQISVGFTDTVNHLNEIVAVQTKKNLQLETVNLHHYIERCLETIAMDIKQAGVIVYNKVPADTEFAYNTAYLESIVLNFLTNAVKYRSHDRQPTVELSVHPRDNGLVLDIKDNGIGINLKENGSKLFGMYNTFGHNPDARGIGLFITKYQVEAMGGNIEVASEPGLGTTFSVYFPNNVVVG